jgi:carbonic anhydrase
MIRSYKYILLTFVFLSGTIIAQTHTGIDSKSALKLLMDGNKRYLESKATHQDQDVKRRTEVAKGQHPAAVVITCSDSRVPPEILFDQGLGDLFVIRTAGNIVDDIGLGSVEYAVEHLGVQLVIVLGHERCGAVDAAVKGGEAEGHIENLIKAIQPAVEEAKKQTGDLLDNAVRANVRDIVKMLKTNEPILKKLFNEKKIDIVGARYDLDDGIIGILK